MKKALVGTVLALLLLGACLLACQAYRDATLASRARMVHTGDSKAAVKSLLGSRSVIFRPLAGSSTNLVSAMLSVDSETWVYGGGLDIRHPIKRTFPYVYPFKERLFGPDPDDVAVEFDSTGAVRRIAVP
jgi:hypothetical protein